MSSGAFGPNQFPLPIMLAFSNKTNISLTVYYTRMWHPTFNLPVRKWGGGTYLLREIVSDF